MTITIKEFIETMCKEFYEIGQKYPYWGFLLIGEGIEFLGACLDGNDFAKTGLSSDRFDLAMGEFDSLKEYQRFPDLYSNLRCGMTHRKKPIGNIGLCGGDKPANPALNVIYFEPFAKAFQDACKDLIDNNKWGGNKHADDEYLGIIK